MECVNIVIAIKQYMIVSIKWLTNIFCKMYHKNVTGVIFTVYVFLYI